MANLGDPCNVEFELENIKHKSDEVHGSDNPTILTKIQLQQHDDDTEEVEGSAIRENPIRDFKSLAF